MPRTTPRRRTAAAVAAVALVVPGAAAGPSAASGGGDDRREVRAAGPCAPAGAWELRLRADDGVLRVDLRLRGVRTTRPPRRWRVVVVHERRTAARRAAAPDPGGRLAVRLVLPDYAGADAVRVRAYGPRGESCRAAALVA